jgi:hypothetical protein
MWSILTKWLAKQRQTPPEAKPAQNQNRQQKIIAEQVHLHWHINDLTKVPGQFTWNARLDSLNLALLKQPSTTAVYDEQILERAKTQWQFGDWESLASLSLEEIEAHSERAKLALLAAAGQIQCGDIEKARQFIKLAKEWGCSNKLLSQILIAGTYNTLGRAAGVSNQQQRATEHFESAIAVGSPHADIRLLSQLRAEQQLSQLGLTTPKTVMPSTQPTKRLSSLDQSHEPLLETLVKHKAEINTQLEKQANDLISVRKFLDSSLKKEVANATKQIEASIGLQSYFATGDLLSVNTERHSWPISPDFALFLIELLEINDYDLVIEFGSGISTVVVAKTLAKIAPRRQSKPPTEFISFDHLEKYYQQTLTQLQHAGFSETMQLKHAPLSSYVAPNGKTYPYYNCHETLSALAKCHPPAGLRLLVIVDGPPAATGQHARYPAAPVVLAHFKGAQIDLLLDDYIRDDEKEIAQLWQAELTAAQLSHTCIVRQLEKDACLISIQCN